MFWVKKEILLPHERSYTPKPSCYQTTMIEAQPQI